MTSGAVGETARPVESGRKGAARVRDGGIFRGVFRACPIRFAGTARDGGPGP